MTTILCVVACGKEGTVVSTWINIGDYSMEINAEEGTTDVKVPPSLRVASYDTAFKDNLGFTLYYPKADERLDIAFVNLFGSETPQVELPKIKVELGYVLLDSLVGDSVLTSPDYPEDNWKSLETASLKPGQEKKLSIPGAAGHKLAALRAVIYDADADTELIRYMFGFELE